MKRPGCVWTHTLLIENTDLAHIDDLSVMLPVFTRPANRPLNWQNYEEKIEVPIVFDLLPEQINRLKETTYPLHAILSALYSDPEKQIFWATEKTSAEIEYLTFAIWSQQWAKLRRIFSFCTGAISDRKLPDRLMDWQVVPIQASREITVNLRNIKFIEDSIQSKNEDKAWVNLAVRDLFTPRSSMRTFLRTLGTETSKGRADFNHLVNLFHLLNNSHVDEDTISKLLSTIATLYPNFEEGSRTKHWLFGDSTDLSAINPVGRQNLDLEPLVLQGLSTTNYSNSFDADSLQIEKRAAKLLKNDPEAAFKIANLIDPNIENAVAKAFFEGLTERLTSTEAFRLSDKEFDLFILLLKRAKILATCANVWRCAKDQQQRLFETFISDVEETDLILPKAIEAMLNAESDELASMLASRYPALTVSVVLDWSSKNSGQTERKVTPGWLHAISTHADFAINWLLEHSTPPTNASLLLSLVLNPYSTTLRKLGTDPWVELAHSLDEIADDDRTNAAFFLLAFALGESVWLSLSPR
jgi:hypothetical protein